MDVDVDYHPPSYKMLLAHTANYSDGSLKAACNSFGTYLQSRQLNIDNVLEVLHTLLTIEDISEMQPYVDLMLYNVKVCAMDEREIDLFINLPKEHIRKYKQLLSPNIDEIVLLPTTTRIAPKILTLIPHKDEIIKPGVVAGFRAVARFQRLTQNGVVFNFRDLNGEPRICPLDLNCIQNFNVIFRSPRIPFIRMFDALETLKNSPKTLRYIFPNSNAEKLAEKSRNLVTLTLINKSIEGNEEQLQAVQQIVTGPNSLAPYIVFGPPGTGKTTTVVEAILQLYLQNDHNRILVTAGSNSACNTIASKLSEYFWSEKQRILKDLKTKEKHGNLNFQEEKEKKQILDVLSGKSSPSELVRVFSASVDFKNVDSVLRHFCSAVSFTNLKDLFLSSFRIIVATLCTVGRIYSASHDTRFTHIFIDEAAASSEPETLMGISVKNTLCHVILSGDHKQLGAVIKTKRAESLGLGRSLMERLIQNKLYEVDESGNYDRTLQTRLRRNFRSHPEIVGIYNKLYYDGDLIPLAPPEEVNMAANWSMLRNTQFPIVFQAVNGISTRKPNSTTWLNQEEASVVCQIVKDLLKHRLQGGVNVEEHDIGIITPYLGQCHLLTRKLGEMGCSEVKVGSVESYQGCEMPIIIVSMVSSQGNPQFLANPRRINVFLSRPKSLLILIGNPRALIKIPDFKYIINQIKMKNNFFECNMATMRMCEKFGHLRFF